MRHSPVDDNEVNLVAREDFQYRQEVELFSRGATSFYNKRRYDNLFVGTPAEMPVPWKELGVFGQPLYTWGGPGNPRQSVTPP